jgi:alpha-glucosidase
MKNLALRIQMNEVKKVMITSIIILAETSGAFALGKSREIEISSPDKQLSVKVFIASGDRLSYSINSDGIQVIEKSSLGITVDSIDLGRGAKIISSPVISKISEDYPLLGNHPIAHNQANEANIPIETLGKKFTLIMRVYNDGVAIRYTIPEGSKHIDSESTSWNLPEETSKIAWSGFNQSYEEYSYATSLEKIPQDIPVMAPLTIELANRYLSISEADCENFSDMAFIRNGNIFKATFPFSKQGWNIQRRADNSPLAPDGRYLGQNVSPWRTTIVAKSLTALVNSDLIMNVCPAPAKGMDFSWVQPGRCLWHWWSIGSPKYDDQKNWYDAAAKLKWEYYLIDEGWSYWEQPNKDQWALLSEVIAYGKSVGVKSIVWVNSSEMREAKERRSYLEKVKAIGADGIKIDFIPDATSDIMQWYVGTEQDCAELKLLLNFHGSVKPTGLRRTYPNDITREAVRGNEYNMTRYNRVAPFEQDVCLPFTRLMAGAADITPVILNPVELTATKFTWAHEFAQAIIFLSPLTHFTDHYKFYLESPMLDLFQEIPTVWDETRVLSCTNIGEVIAFARRKGNTWWVGVMNGAHEREIKIPLDFLKNSVKATLIYDSHINNTSIDRHETTASPNDVLTIKLVPGGGFVARL